nr:hypothetical protein [Tanacetum cinerariifolium]
MEDLKQQYLDKLKRLSNLKYHHEIKIDELKENFNGMSIAIRKKEKLLQQEQWAYLSTHPSKHLHSFCFDDDDDEDYTFAITHDEPVLSTEEPDNSLSMGDEHLDTISATESDEFIKSGIEDLILIPSESEGIPEHIKKEKLLQQEQWAYLSTHPSKHLHSFCFDDDDDEDYTFAITHDEPVLSTEEPDNSLSMGDEHLDTISATESDEFIKSGVEDLILIPSESEGIPEHMCDVPSHDNSLPLDVSNDQFEDLSESNEEFSSTDDDSFSFDKIDYVEASPPNSDLVSSEVMEIVVTPPKWVVSEY